jgi:hypothetical protein
MFQRRWQVIATAGALEICNKKGNIVDKSSKTRDNQALISVPVAEIEVRPFEEPCMSLGIFTSQEAPKGFSIEVIPQLKDPSTVVADVTMRKIKQGSEFVLHIVNKSNKTVSVAAWQLS